MLKLNFKKLLILFITLCTSIILATEVKADTINNFDINMKVQEDGIIQVKQKLNVSFDYDKHGIYAIIPSEYTMTWSKDNIKKYYFPISNIQVKNFPYEVEQQLDGVLIKIGDPDKYLSGNQTFEYSYQIKTKDLRLDNRQLLYFDLVGSGWEMPIKKVDFKIEMPKSFKTTPEFFGPAKDANINYIIKDNKIISGSMSTTLNYSKALTIKLDLPNDYFNYTNTNSFEIISIVISAIILLISIIIYWPRRRVKLTPVIEFKAPSDLSSAQVSYIYNNSVIFKKMSSLIIYWASKGYLIITELNSKKKLFLFTKVKDIDNNEMFYEQELFRKFFKKNEVKSNKVPSEFSKAITTAKFSYKNYFENEQPIFNKKNILKIKLLTFLASLAFALFVFVVAYHYYEMLMYPAIYALLSFVIVGLLNSWYVKIIDSLYIRKTFKKTIKLVISYLIYIIVFMIFNLMLYYFDANYLLISYLIMLASIIFTSLIRRRTEQGILLLERILGLKEFINTAEKERLEQLVNDNPEYFYEVLPYAYVLDVSNKWSKKFEGLSIPQPAWYDSNIDVFDILIMNSIINSSLNSVNQSISSSIGKSISSGTGGFSSGGGGTSGGGFGGGGGGSW